MTTPDAFAQKVAEEFGLSFTQDGYQFNGTHSDTVARQVSSADGFATVVEGMRAQGMAFNRIFVIPGQTVVVIFNQKPPLALTTGLSAKEMVRYMSDVIQRTGKKVVTFRQSYILDLT